MDPTGLGAVASLGKWGVILVIVAFIAFVLWRAKRSGRVEAERDALDQTLRDAHEAAVTHADTRRATDGDLADRLPRITKP